MKAAPHEGEKKEQSQEMRQFLAWAYWVVGVSCFWWETSVFITVNRPGTLVELPLLGDCSASEALIYTLTFFWIVLLALHLLVHAHQSWAQHGSFSAQFPGVLGDKEIPRPLGALRVLLFVVLVAWPTALHVFHTCRTFDHMAIVLNVGGSVYPGTNFDKGKSLGWLRAPVSGEWRWLHWRDKIEEGQPDKDGKPQPAKVSSKTWVTAIPILQPWGFVLAALAFTGSLGWQVARAFRRRE